MRDFQVAEVVVVGGGGGGGEIVGMIRGCIKTVTCGSKVCRNGKNKPPHRLPVYTKLAYILGLRVSPTHRYPFLVFFSRKSMLPVWVLSTNIRI